MQVRKLKCYYSISLSHPILKIKHIHFSPGTYWRISGKEEMATVEGCYILCASMMVYMQPGGTRAQCTFSSLGTTNCKQFCWVMPLEGPVFLGFYTMPFTHKPRRLLKLLSTSRKIFHCCVSLLTLSDSTVNKVEKSHWHEEKGSSALR